jgi:hypothetical protein
LYPIRNYKAIKQSAREWEEKKNVMDGKIE